MPQSKRTLKELRLIPETDFIPRWAGLATTKRPYHLKNSLTGPQVQLVQRSGERPETYTFKNIRYGQMTMALLAQTAIHQLRQRLGSPYATWDAKHLARSIFNGIDGDLCVHHDTVVVTLYNAPHPDLLRQHDEHLPEKLAAERVNPHVPWLFNFKLDFRFR